MPTRRRAFCVLVVVGAALLVTAAVAFASASARPTGVKIYINGKPYPTSALVGGQDDYTPVKSGKVRVEARWRGSVTGSGYYVVVGTTEPTDHNYRTCRIGTSCTVLQRPRINPGGEYTWAVKIMKTRTRKLAAGYKACLVGR